MLTKSIVTQIKRVAKNWQTDLGLPFQAVLPATTVVTAAAVEGIAFRERIFSPGSDAVGFSLPSLERRRNVPRGGQSRDRASGSPERGNAVPAHERLLQSAAAFDGRSFSTLAGQQCR